ncbi:MAG TPA: hypothetical protein VJA21_33115 [Verrucomicrobiae bacterium]
MNADYRHTATANLQMAGRFPRRALRTPVLATPFRPQPAAKREVLRALRAAEMAAWEAAPPSTVTEPRSGAGNSLGQILRAQAGAGLDRESLLIFILAASGLLGLLFAL